MVFLSALAVHFMDEDAQNNVWKNETIKVGAPMAGKKKGKFFFSSIATWNLGRRCADFLRAGAYEMLCQLFP